MQTKSKKKNIKDSTKRYITIFYSLSMDKLRDEVYNRLISGGYINPDKNNPDMVRITEKAIALVDSEKNIKKGPKEQCNICNKHTLKQCYRCENYFCDKHIDPDPWGDYWCQQCDEFIDKNF